MNRSIFVAAMSLLFLGVLMVPTSRADNATSAADIAPKGLSVCTVDDPVAVLEARVATSIGGQFLSCFRSEAQGQPEYAFAISLAANGAGYTSADLDKLRSTVTTQWNDFQPLSKEFHDNYIARLNELIKGAGGGSTTFALIKPVLVAIDRLDAKSYSVVSIRSYLFNDGSAQVRTTKISADAVVLRGRDFIRLTMQRVLTKAPDVAALRAEIAEWARVMEG